MTATSTIPIVVEPEPTGQWRALVALAAAMVLAMSAWFSTAAVLPLVSAELDLSTGFARLVTVAVQVGFVAGALASATLALADRFPPRTLVARGGVVVAAVNLAPLVVPSAPVLLASRLAVGASLALVGPPLLASMATWFRLRRGVALGVMVGALTVGSALPHLLKGVGLPDWRVVVVATSAMALLAAAVTHWCTTDGPLRLTTGAFDVRRIGEVLANRGVRLATAGYLGHMWELYAGWTWMALFLRDALGLSDEVASLATFAVIAVGALGSVAGGFAGERLGRAPAARIALLCSGTLSAGLGFTTGWPAPVVLILALSWGFWVIADSAQFTTLVTEHARSDQVGTAVTLQLASGFALTALTMWLVPVAQERLGWGLAMALLAPGPLLGALAMRRLEAGTVESSAFDGTPTSVATATVERPVAVAEPLGVAC